MSRVFVYGSLLRGLHNHHLLLGQKLLAPARTKHAAYRLLDSKDGYPYVTQPVPADTASTYSIQGELYEVGSDALAKLDELEEHPDWYCRHQVEIEGESEPAWMYLMPQGVMDATHDGAQLPEATPRGDWRAHVGKLSQLGHGEHVTPGTWLDTQVTVGMDGRHACFSYGSNGIEQLRERCQNPHLVAFKAMLPHAARIFGGWSSWWHGAVASVVPMAGCEVPGSVVYLSEAELKLLDGFEGVGSNAAPYDEDGAIYCRQDIVVRVGSDAVHEASSSTAGASDIAPAGNKARYDASDATTTQACDQPLRAVMYRKLEVPWRGPPSEAYLEACRRNLRPFWPAAEVEVMDGEGKVRS